MPPSNIKHGFHQKPDETKSKQNVDKNTDFDMQMQDKRQDLKIKRKLDRKRTIT